MIALNNGNCAYVPIRNIIAMYHLISVCMGRWIVEFMGSLYPNHDLSISLSMAAI